MPVPPDFQFSQGSLQDFADCPRRFELRYVQELAWPAVEAEPVEEHEAGLADGEAFHRLAHQHALGLPAEKLAALAGSAAALDLPGGLPDWWKSFVNQPPAGLPALRYPEVALSAPIGRFRLVAQYDLIAVEPGRRAVIVDWKTGERRPAAAWLAARLQTRVYRWLLVEAGAHLNGPSAAAVRPNQVEMLYWFANYPDQPERLRYDTTQHRADGVYLRQMIADIASREAGDFPLTADERHCRFCAYRSLCERRVEAGEIGGDEDATPLGESTAADWQAAFDFEQLAEVAF